ncbi:helix-turn-helix domain-containing protein [Deinococcus frigens]|uniref:helix-turn-helix domain-containing protein n=1 Tax=Deinococcus frigens TaxID=249403 RepID=UPI00138DDCD1|nr:helix-turn-helix domain-containing protein [Deinococcus frigens]
MPKVETKTRTMMEWRKARGLSVQEFADALDVSIAQASNYLYGRAEPLVSRAIKIAEVLGVRVEDVQWNVDPRTLELPPMPPGEPGVVTPERLEIAKVWLNRGMKKTAVARELGITRQTLYKYL